MPVQVCFSRLILPPFPFALDHGLNSTGEVSRFAGNNEAKTYSSALLLEYVQAFSCTAIRLKTTNQGLASLEDSTRRLILRPCPFRYAETMTLPTLAEIHEAQSLLYRHMPPTPQYTWPLINQRLGAETWIKHENQTSVGAFKIRGALVYVSWLKQTQPELRGVVAATRGNHGQGVAMAARLVGVKAVIVVPHGNSKEKNRAMVAQGAELVEYGHDFQESLEYARTFATERGLAMVDSFHERLVMGTATYALEFLQSVPPLDRIYLPIGLGSSICGVSAARNALGLKTEIIGVVSSASPSYALSFAQRQVVQAPSKTVLADGLACRMPAAPAMEIIWNNVSRIVEVSDTEIAEAMRIYFQDTHNVAEGAGAAPLAAALKEQDQNRDARIGLVLTGGNVDLELYNKVLAGAI
jgi:threonine dehydratase